MIDWKDYDFRTQAWEIRDAADFIESFIDFKRMTVRGKVLKPFSDDKAQRFRLAWKWTVDNFIHSKIMLPNGQTYQKNHGIPSGSKFTSIFGSIINFRRIIFLLQLQGIAPQEIEVLGDDGNFELKGAANWKFSITKFTSDALAYFNAMIHPEKLQISQFGGTTTIIGYNFSGPYIVQERIKLFMKAIFTDHWIKDPETAAGRMYNHYLLGGSRDKYYEIFFFAYLKLKKVTRLKQTLDNKQKFLRTLAGYDLSKIDPDNINAVDSSLRLTTRLDLSRLVIH